MNQLRPRLRPQVQVRRRIFRGQPWYVLHDAVTNLFFRLSPVSFHLVGLLDGRRTVEEAWNLTAARHGDDAPTQHEAIGLLGQLNEANLLRVDLPVDAQPMLARQTRRRWRRWAGQAMSVLFLQIPLINPDPLLRWLGPLFRPILSRAGLALWALWLLIAAWIFAPHLPEFLQATRGGDVLAPANWGWMALTFAVIKVIHELGHGLVCRRFGAVVPEAGIMLLVLFPCPYVDATSAWGLAGKWQRLLVGAAGMIFELAVAAAAAVVWVYAEPGTLPRQLAHQVVLLASVTTILFNANPLMRFDGYFMLSDLLESANLYERANRQVRYVAQRWLLGLKDAQPAATDRREQATLTVYGILAAGYRVLVMLGITLFVMGWAFTLGLVLALWSVVAWAVIPAVRLTRWLVAGPELHRRRLRAVAVSAAAAAAVVVLVGLWPMPERRWTQGVIEAAERSDVSVAVPGFVRRVAVEAGQPVRAGEVLLETEDPVLPARLRELEAEIEALEVVRSQALRDNPGDAQAAAARLDVRRGELRDVRQKIAQLTIRSPREGRLVGPHLGSLTGYFLKRGEVVAQVVDLRSLRVTAMMDQSQNALELLSKVETVELRPAGNIPAVLTGRVLRVFDAGRSHLPHPALGAAGGGQVLLDPQDPHGLTTLKPQFELWLGLPDEPVGAWPQVQPGQRVHVRFTLSERRPWLAQIYHRVRQVFRERINL